MVHFTPSCVLLGFLNNIASRGYGFSACGGIRQGYQSNLYSCQMVRRGPESTGNTNLEGRISDDGRVLHDNKNICLDWKVPWNEIKR